MKQAILVAATVAVFLGLAGCTCHNTAGTAKPSASTNDNSGYQSGYSSKLGSKKSH